ncbi:iron chelate uptake ABC transporter family permease subunit [Nocardioides humi]|uniref:Iron chelate uptake ABC transporter family permease subunit n=2 Tax=Nocardioides humi TaxID=449461 RepID=A0ABN2AA14_9ACTN
MAHRWWAVGLLALLGCLVVASLFVGSESLSPARVWASLTGSGASDEDAIVHGLRVPRTVLGVLLGAALGLAGALSQEHTRNPLADPGLLGVTAGAATGVVVAIMAFGLTSVGEYLWFALAGALLAAFLVLGIAARITVFVAATTVVLTGSIVTALLGSISSIAVLLDRTVADVFRYWTVGSLAGRDFGVVGSVTPLLAIGLVLAALNLPALNPLALGDVSAQSLGRNVGRDRLIGLTSVACLAAAATAACGSVAFLGLLVPHVARTLAGANRTWAAVLSVPVGGCIVLVADMAGRVMLAHSEVPVGIVLALVGTPAFVLIARRKVHE